MRHSDLREGAIPQCTKQKSPRSNLFCQFCHDDHEEYWKKHHPEDYPSE